MNDEQKSEADEMEEFIDADTRTTRGWQKLILYIVAIIAGVTLLVIGGAAGHSAGGALLVAVGTTFGIQERRKARGD